MDRSVIFKGLALLAAGYAILVLLAWVFQRGLIYFPTRNPPAAAPAVLGEAAEDVVFKTEDGLQLAGWFVRGGPATRGPTVLVFNGNAGDRSYRTELAAALSDAGLSVLLFDYRGYGGNLGRPSEQGLRRDARAALAYLRTRDDVDPARIVYLGESLGSAVAIGLAAEQSPWALVLRSPFTSLAALGQRHFPFLPVRLLLKDRFSCTEPIAKVGAPILVIAGEADTIVPLRFSQALYGAAPEPKRLVVLDGVDHNDPEFLDGAEFIGAVLGFIGERE